jgi:hypothetical protein
MEAGRRALISTIKDHPRRAPHEQSVRPESGGEAKHRRADQAPEWRISSSAPHSSPAYWTCRPA